MSTITGTGHSTIQTPAELPKSTVGSAQTVQTSAVSPQTASPIAAWINFGPSGYSTDLLGIAQPRSPGDTAAMLAQVSMLLEDTLNEADKSRMKAIMEGFRSLFGTNDVTAMQGRIDTARVRIAENNVSIGTKIEEKAVLEGDRAELDHIIGNLNGQIASLEVRVGAAPPGSALRQQLINELNGRKAERADRQADRNEVQQAIGAKEGEIDALVADNSSKQAVISNELNTYQTLQNLTMNLFMAVATASRGAVQEDSQQTAGRLSESEDAFEALAETVDELAGIDRMRAVADEVRDALAAAGENMERVLDAVTGLLNGLIEVYAALAHLNEAGVEPSAALERGSRLRVPA